MPEAAVSAPVAALHWNICTLRRDIVSLSSSEEFEEFQGIQRKREMFLQDFEEFKYSF